MHSKHCEEATVGDDMEKKPLNVIHVLGSDPDSSRSPLTADEGSMRGHVRALFMLNRKIKAELAAHLVA